MANPFEIALVITAFLLIGSAAFGIIAPSFNIDVPDAPVFPNLPDLSVQGNLTGDYAFSETHDVIFDTGQLSGLVKFTTFSPDKQVITKLEGPSFWTAPIDVLLSTIGLSTVNLYPVYVVERYGTFLIVPHWYNEPISFLNGTDISHLTPQIIVDNYNGSYSNFVVDKGNNLYECFMSFSPLPGASSMAESWNSGHGFVVWLYGSAYSPPEWTTQAVAYLTWFGSVIAYFVYFIAYIIQLCAVLFTTLGALPALANGIIILIVITFIGSLLVYLRGGGGNK